MASRILVLFGSARSDGYTMQAVNTVLDGQDAEMIDLRLENLSGYDYAHGNQEDAFFGIAEKMTQADILIFATPVYWYSMSGVLKNFFDRFTDLITLRKDLGRALKGRKCYLIACGADNILPPGFENPFKATCDYLDMEYKACFYYASGKNAPSEDEVRKAAAEFGRNL